MNKTNGLEVEPVSIAETQSFIVTLKYTPQSDHHFIEFSNENGVVISVLISEGVANGLSRSMNLKIVI
jgi:hypothetical protein